jgi:formamidopyrimidine-DNA glycosylase
MPELPEVETVRRDLEGEVVGRRIEEAVITGHRTVRRHAPELLVSVLRGRSIDRVRRHGKFLLVDLDGEVTMGAHLRMSGQLLWTPDGSEEPLPHTHARLVFEDGTELRFVDPRTFGELWVTSPSVPELSHLGPDALDALPLPPQLRSGLEGRRTTLKARLLDQTYLAGIGNIYADEILFLARLRPSRSCGSVSAPASVRLHDAIGEVLANAVEARGSSLKDQRYVDAYGRTGTAQLLHRVHAREGKPCEVCGSVVRRVVLAGRSTYFCPRCQR